MTAPSPSLSALEAAVNFLWPLYTDKNISRAHFAAGDIQCQRLAVAFDRYAAERVAAALSDLTCAACGGPYPNANCGHRKNAEDMRERVPCAPGASYDAERHTGEGESNG